MPKQNPTPAEGPPEERYATPPPPPPRRGPFERTPFLASILSMLPGLGHVYNGLYNRALIFAVIFFGLLAVAIHIDEGPELGFIIPAMVFLWFFNLIDAYRQAVLINYGYAPGRDLPENLAGSVRGSGGLVLGAVIFLLGLFGLVHHLFPGLDLSVLFEFWYLPFLAFGAWLFYQAWKDRRSRDQEPTSWTAVPPRAEDAVPAGSEEEPAESGDASSTEAA